MPIQRIQSGRRVGYKWGSSGKIYWGPRGRALALLQASAAYAAGYRAKSSTDGK